MSANPLRTRTVAAFTLLYGAALLPGLTLFAGSAAAQGPANSTSARSTSCASSKAQGVVALRAPAAKALSLCDGYALSSSAGGAAGTPLALASADFNEDGVPDLVSGYSSGSAGTLVVHRGNVAALWPYGTATQNGTPASFLPNAKSFAIPEAPDFVVTGDFDADGHADVVTAHRGSSALYFFKGDGHGGFAAAKRFDVSGFITDLIAGEINRPDGLADLVVGVTSAGGSAALVYESPNGALKGQPESFALTQPVSAMALGKFSGSTMRDLAIGAGTELALVHGRDRKLVSSSGEPAMPAIVTRQKMGYNIRALAAGDFTGRLPSVAALGDDDAVHVLEHSVTSEAMSNTLGDTNAATSLRVLGDASATSYAMSGAATHVAQTRMNAMRQMVAQNGSSASEWSERSNVPLPGGFSPASHGLIASRISGSSQEDLLVVDRSNNKVHVLSTRNGQKVSTVTANNAGVGATGIAQMNVLGSLDADSAPAAVLPMRLNQHGLNGLVSLQAGEQSPVVMPNDVAPSGVFTVTNTLDITDPSQKNSPPAGSLRAAMENAQEASGTNGGGTYSIVFNIPTTDPGYNPATGIFKIQPLSENVPNSLDNFALPPINATLTIDGYTQPGASPNTSATADNAKILIQIDGGKATTTGGSGLVPFDDSGTVIRGIAFTGWTNPSISNGTASGAEGIEANGIGDFIEGNFFGTADGKTAIPNRIGIFADNGPLFGSAPGNIIGGTTPQARNILSGNSNSGILFLSTAYEAQLQGNFIGLDSTGAAVLPNPQQAGRSNIFDGVGLNGPTVTVGGTAPGATNFIAGNGTNVDINDLTNGNAAANSFVVGNRIGTDSTGTIGFPGQGYGVSILHNPKNMTIGGTSPAARNVISGNLAGVYVFDNSQNNSILGNYIGTDITGTKSVPNTQQGFISGATTTNAVPAAGTTISGNVISGNTLDGIQISGTYSSSPGYTPYVGSTIQGNYIGTDYTGTEPLANAGNGVSLLSGATNNTVGGSATGLGNLIANNAMDGVHIDPGTGNGPGVANVTIGNIIASNAGTGVRIVSGTGNRISANSIFGNTASGIDIDTAGPSTNTPCNATNSGANMLQNYPVLTPGSGTTYITATATDPNGNTSEFSKAVAATPTANLLALMGTFSGTANTNFTIEFFSNDTAGPGGYGEGKTYLGSTTVTTDANCNGNINKPIDLTTADVSVNLTQSTQYFSTGADFGLYSYSAAVANNGPATAHGVMVTDILPSSLTISKAYCNVGPCQSPITTTQGTCSISGQTITCNLGTLAPGATANIVIPVQVLTVGTISNIATVMATEIDPFTPNNTSTQNATSEPAYPFIDHISPTTVLANSPDTIVDVYGVGFTPNLTATFNNVPVTVKGFVDNQVCGGPYQPQFCSDLQILVPASQLTTAGPFTIAVSDSTGDTTSATFTVASACTYSVYSSLDSDYENTGTNLIAGSLSIATNVPGCPYTAISNMPWAVVLDNSSGTGSGTVDIAIAPNTTPSTRAATITVAGNTFSLTQDAGDATVCNVTLDQTAINAPAVGGTGTINATLSNSSCAPFAEPYPESSWITITNKSNLLVANGPVNYTVAPNNGPARMGAIAVGGNVATITQAAPSCYFTLSSTSVLAPAGGTTGSITVTPTPSNCAWNATPSNNAQVSIMVGSSGNGNGTISYTVAPNAGGPITPTISIGDAAATSVFTINQASAYSCTFTISPGTKSVTSNGTSDFVQITASYANCKWTAASNSPDGLTLTGATSGTGSGALYYTVTQNTGAARTLTLTAGCQQFTINQDGSGVSNPIPSLTSLQPSSANAGSVGFSLTVNGTGFVGGSVVNFNSVPRATTYVNATQLSIALSASDVANPGTASITVSNPQPGGGTSAPLTFTINTPSNNPVPLLTSLQPSGTSAGSAAFPLTVIGANFVPGATINFGNATLTTTFVSATQLTATVASFLVTSQGTAAVTVTNPTPGGGTSTPITFTITAPNNPSPTLTALQPSSTTAGAVTFPLTVTGTNFISTSVVNFGSTTLTTTFVSATQLTAMVPASLVAAQGTTSVTVTNPAPGGGTSAPLTFTINGLTNPLPTLTSLQPTSVAVGSGNFSLTVNGTNFISTSKVNFNGIALTTTYVSATQLNAAVPASDVAAAGTSSITVTSPAPGGGTSNSLALTVTAAPTFTLSSSGAQTLNVGGTAQYTITAAAMNGTYANPITFSISGLPAGATASFSPSSVTPNATTASSTLTITVGQGLADARRASGGWSLALLGLPFFGLLMLRKSRRKRFMAGLTATLALIVSISVFTGCGQSGFNFNTTTSQAYGITVTGTSGSTTATTTIQLTVNTATR